MPREHRMEFKMAILTVSGADRDKPGSVKLALEGVIASMSALHAKEAQAKDSKRQVLSASKLADQIQMSPIADLLSAAAAFQRGNGNRGNGNFPSPCDDCGVRHKGTCHAKLLADGKAVPGWADKSAEQQARITSRSDDIERLRHFANSASRVDAKGAVPMQSLLALLSALPGGQMMTISPNTMANVNVVRSTHGGAATHDRICIIIDTGNLPGKHLISYPSFFTALDRNAQPLPVAGATRHCTHPG